MGLALLVWAALTVVGVEPFDNEGWRVALVSALALALLALAATFAVALRRDAAAAREAADARAEADRERDRAQDAQKREAEARERAEAAQASEAEERQRAEAAQASEAEEHQRAEAALTSEAEAREQAAQRERETDEHRRGAARAVAALERERHWSRELRSQVIAMHQARSALAPRDDLRSLVLRVALDLTDAPKGLLLARADDDEGRLDVIAAEGFDEDAGRSEIAQSFAERVVERGIVIREDSPRPTGAPVDGEISALIAIPMYMADEFTGVVICADRPGGFDDCDDEVLLSLGDHAGSVLQNTELHGQLRDAFVATVLVLTEAIQAKDPFLRGHSEDVADYVDAVSRQLGVDDREREQLAFASLLHDVGKIGISESILLKPGRLSPEERSVVELHPHIGFRLVEQVPGMEDIAPVVLYHHERWDGDGYPARLRGEEIPLGARLVGVADAFSAMTEQRPYRDRMSLEAACAELERCAGSQFDPRVVGLFTTEVREHPRERRRGPVAEAFADAQLEARRSEDEGVLGAGTAALTDSLTLLYSHRYFHEAARSQAERAELQGRGFSVVLAELSELGELNREDGYARGDDALRACAHALSQLAVRHGAVACRTSGRRLALLVEAMDAPAASALAVELQTTLLPLAAVRVGAATWHPGLTGDAVVDRARENLVTPMGRSEAQRPPEPVVDVAHQPGRQGADPAFERAAVDGR